MKTALIPLTLFALLAQDGKESLQVVATLGHLKWTAEQIGGDRVKVDALAPAGQDPHYIVPTPDLQRRAGRADVFIQVGRSMELWAKNVLDGSANSKIQPGQPGHVVASTSCELLELPREFSREGGDIHPEGNPHVWLDPLNMRVVASNIADAFSKVDPAGAETYRRNREAFDRRLWDALFGPDLVSAVGAGRMGVLERRLRSGELEEYLKDRGLLDKLGGWIARARPLRGAKVVTYHKTYSYFAKRFGIEVVAELEEKPGLPPTAAQRDKVVEIARRHAVKAILNDNFYPRAAADYVARETGAKVIVAYIDVGALEEVPDYFRLIDRLLDSLLEAVK
jgi:zinc/manganese transport system substrate-binding protein